MKADDNLELNRQAETWKWTAQVIATVSVLVFAAGAALSLRYDPEPFWTKPPSEAYAVIQILITGSVYILLGWLIGTRRPGHVVGALFLLIGLLFGVNLFGAGLLFYLESQPDGAGALLPYLAWSGELLWLPPFLFPFTLVLQFFPDGRLPSPRWRIVPAFLLGGVLLMTGSTALAPWPFGLATGEHNPFALRDMDGVLSMIYSAGSFLLILGTLGSLVTVVVRFRRSHGREREQMKWLVYTAAVGVLLLLLTTLGGIEEMASVIFLSLPTALALAMGIAILRHRLWDIDLIIRRTLQYAALSGILALLYFGGIVLLQSAFRSVTGQADSPLITVITTLAIAALFNPLRRRIQDVVDRRFYREKYDAARTLAAFAHTARDETDLDVLTAELLGVVQDTMQPERLLIWVKAPDRPLRNELRNGGEMVI